GSSDVCSSDLGLKAVMLADQGIRVGDIDVAVAGGMESMSHCPYLLPRVRDGLRMGNGEVVDSMIHDGLWCAFEQCHMGNAGEVVAEQYKVSRDAQDDYAARSHQKAARANDGGSALVVMAAEPAKSLGLTPLARIVGQATSGLPPKLVLMTPVEAVRRVIEKTGWRLGDVNLVELNEAFAVQAVAVLNELGIDPEKVNVNGGAVALGHAIGSSGGRVLTTLLYALKRRHLKRGIATLCLGGGNGLAVAVETVCRVP